jgi:hypothetical protein
LAQSHYTAEVKSGLLLALPIEAEELHLKPGDKVDVQLEMPMVVSEIPDKDPTIALLESWIAQAPTDPAAIREAEDDLREFKRNLNAPRKEAGARLHFPEVE